MAKKTIDTDMSNSASVFTHNPNIYKLKDTYKATSSKKPPYHLIPTDALGALAERFAEGIERHGSGAWNANLDLEDYTDVLEDKKFLLDRVDHVIAHALEFREKLRAGSYDGDDDGAAIMWAGALFSEARRHAEGV